MSTNNILITCFVFITSILSAQTVEVRKNANNEPRVEIVHPNANTFIGDAAGRINTGHHNNFNGHQSGYNNTTGSENSFFGYNSGYTNSSGNSNSFFGWNSGFSNTTGQNILFLDCLRAIRIHPDPVTHILPGIPITLIQQEPQILFLGLTLAIQTVPVEAIHFLERLLVLPTQLARIIPFLGLPLVLTIQ